MTQDIHPLAAGFPAADDESWRQLAEKALKGADIERITRRTVDGVARGPLFTKAHLEEVSDPGAPGAAPFVRGLDAARDAYLPWDIRQAIDEPDPKRANAAILDELNGGTSQIALHLDPAGRTGVAVRTLDEMKTTLDGVMLDLAPVHLVASQDAEGYAAIFVALLEDSGLDAGRIRGGLGLDPIGTAATSGSAQGLDGALSRAVQAAGYLRDAFPGLKTIRVGAAPPHEAGGSEAQELAWLCASGAGYMRALLDAGLSRDEAAATLEFTIAADADIHLTISKLRAARRVWARVAEAFGCSPQGRGMRLHAVTSARMLTARDAWTNLIRNTCAAFGAAAGGADAITVRPFTDVLGAPTKFARRLARNLQVMLAEESHLGKVADPAGGGYLHETVGQRLADKAWALFQEIEARGGAIKAVCSGWLQDEISKVRQVRRNAYATGKESLIGVSTYPQLDARPVETAERDYTPGKLDAEAIEAGSFADRIEAARSGAQVGEQKPGQAEPSDPTSNPQRFASAAARPHPGPVPWEDRPSGCEGGQEEIAEFEPLEPVRFAEDFEALRDAADAHAARTGSRPAAFLATLGTLPEFNARAAFARNRLAVGGVETPEPGVYDTITACAAALKGAATPLAIICGTDEAYSEHAAALAGRLKQAGAREVWLAGRPMDIAGIDRFIHMRSDAVEDLASAHTILGVA